MRVIFDYFINGAPGWEPLETGEKMEIKNLFESDVKALQKKVQELQRENPDIRMNIFEQNNTTFMKRDETEERLIRIEDKIDSLSRKIDLIFGDHFIRDGKFEKIPIL